MSTAASGADRGSIDMCGWRVVSRAGSILGSAVLVGCVLAGIQLGTVNPVAADSGGVSAYSWGVNTSGQLGTGDNSTYVTPADVASLPGGAGAVSISAGADSTYAVGSDGYAYAWGDNSSGQLGDPSAGASSNSPVRVQLPDSNVSAIAGGSDFALAVDDGHVYAWGDDSSGELGPESCTGTTPCEVTGLPSGASAVAAGGDASYALVGGNVYAWGGDAVGELGDGGGSGSATPVEVAPGVFGGDVVAISAGSGFAFALLSDGHLYGWGYNGAGELGTGSTVSPATPTQVALSGVTSVAAGFDNGYAIAGGTLYSWGNGYGLGNGTSVSYADTPQVVTLPGGAEPVVIAGGLWTGYATGNDGNTYSWGLNDDGQAGNNTTGGIDTSPVQVDIPGGVTPSGLAAGNNDAFAISVPFTAPLLTTFYTLQNNSYVITTDQPGATLSIASGTLPPGVTLTDDVATGSATLFGAPTCAAAGTYTFGVEADWTQGDSPISATQPFTLSVTSTTTTPPVFYSGDALTVTTNVAMTPFEINTSCSPAPSLTAKGLPQGLSVTGDGTGSWLLKGTPSMLDAGLYDVSLTAKTTLHRVVTTTTQTLAITVEAGSVFRNKTSTTILAGGTVDFSVTVVAYPTAALSMGGTPPPWVSFTDNDNNTGTLSGTAPADGGGKYHLVFTATNANGTSNQSFYLTVDQPPAITSGPSSATVAAGTKIVPAIQWTATGYPHAKFSYTVNSVPSCDPAGTLPGGLTLSASGKLTGTPALTSPGTYDITIIASNVYGGTTQTATQDFLLTVTGSGGGCD